MSTPIITVENLGKKYRLDHQVQRQRYTALRDVIADKAKHLFRAPFARRKDPDSSGRTEEFWALKDVSFEVTQGEVIGIIGRNGAGKSTLLKILSRITEPTAGRVRLRGRVASLLEVGTGFHPELTGRENIYLNGAILGMTRGEIRRKFDEIVAFAEVEKFLDTPVKRYSSGMYVRLAFAVAAHLEPEILVVDEVLAVGDEEFQKKCLGKMQDVSRGGRTVLFVSHNMAAIRALCPTAFLLKSGRVVQRAPSEEVIRTYVGDTSRAGCEADVTLKPTDKRRGSGPVRITAVSFRDQTGLPATHFSIWEPFTVSLSARSEIPRSATFWLLFYASDGSIPLGVFQWDRPPACRVTLDGVTVTAYIDPNGLAPGSYRLAAGAFDSNRDISDWVEDAGSIEIRPEFASGRPFDNRYGSFTLPYQWTIDSTQTGPVGLHFQPIVSDVE
jgi:lipopolysaccharide transport system ATP-binding protein